MSNFDSRINSSPQPPPFISPGEAVEGYESDDEPIVYSKPETVFKEVVKPLEEPKTDLSTHVFRSLVTAMPAEQQAAAAKTDSVYQSSTQPAALDQTSAGHEIPEEVSYHIVAMDQYEELVVLLNREVLPSVYDECDKFYNELSALLPSPESARQWLNDLRGDEDLWKDFDEARVCGSGTLVDTVYDNPSFEELECWRNTELYCAQKANEPGMRITVSFICSLNKKLQISEKVNAGLLRQPDMDHDVYVGSTKAAYVRGPCLERALDEYINWLHDRMDQCDKALASTRSQANQWGIAKGQNNPVVIAAQAYQKLVSIHPFSDGNGRTTRFVMDFILQRYGLPPVAFEEEEDAEVGNFATQRTYSGSFLTQGEVSASNKHVQKSNTENTPSVVVGKILDGIKFSIQLLSSQKGEKK